MKDRQCRPQIPAGGVGLTMATGKISPGCRCVNWSRSGGENICFEKPVHKIRFKDWVPKLNIVRYQLALHSSIYRDDYGERKIFIRNHSHLVRILVNAQLENPWTSWRMKWKTGVLPLTTEEDVPSKGEPPSQEGRPNTATLNAVFDEQHRSLEVYGV